MTNDTLKQVIDMAKDSGQYRETTLWGWISLLVHLACRDHLEVVEANGDVLGFAGWIRVQDPSAEKFETVPRDIDSGKYISVLLACVKDGGSKILRVLAGQIADKAPDAEYFLGTRDKYDESEPRIRRIRR